MYLTVDKNAVTGEVTTREWTQEEIDARIARLTPMEWVNFRNERNTRLAQSDAYVLPDRWATYTPEQQASWASYRQALRDLPQNTTDPFNVTWPLKPE